SWRQSIKLTHNYPTQSIKLTLNYAMEAAIWTARPNRLRTVDISLATTMAANAMAAQKIVLPVRRRKRVEKQERAEESKAQCHILRDVFANPFRPVTIDPSWLTPEVAALAGAIYEEHTLGRMPDLADALEGAGCRSTDILAHCRKGGDHVRGCGVL